MKNFIPAGTIVFVRRESSTGDLTAYAVKTDVPVPADAARAWYPALAAVAGWWSFAHQGWEVTSHQSLWAETPEPTPAIAGDDYPNDWDMAGDSDKCEEPEPGWAGGADDGYGPPAPAPIAVAPPAPAVNRCRRCSGTGRVRFRHVQNGVCFSCGGSGYRRGR